MSEVIDFAGQVVALGAAVAIPVWALIELRARNLFVTRKEYDEDRLAEEKRTTELLIKPLTRIADRMDALATTQARHEEANRGIGRSLDNLRDDLRELRDAG